MRPDSGVLHGESILEQRAADIEKVPRIDVDGAGHFRIGGEVVRAQACAASVCGISVMIEPWLTETKSGVCMCVSFRFWHDCRWSWL